MYSNAFTCQIAVTILSVHLAIGSAQEGRASTGLTPLVEMSATDRYKGEDGGLYGKGRNEPPKEHLAVALSEAEKIVPLDAAGQPSRNGKIVLLSIGMSNTTREFSGFVEAATDASGKNSQVVLVDGAQGGMEASDWVFSKSGEKSRAKRVWDEVQRRVQAAGVSAKQVQVVWIKQARRSPSTLGEFPKHAEVLRDNTIDILTILKQRFPNVRLAYLSSRGYGGFAPEQSNPEPYAYESAFANRWVIQEQMKGTPALNYDPQRGAVKAPLVLWGPYLWADGDRPRKADGLTWQRKDFVTDGVHPSPEARKKIANMLLTFFKTDETAKGWFAKSPK